MKKIKMTNCNEFMIVDDCDLEFAKSRKWHKSKDGYASTGSYDPLTQKSSAVKFHILIMGRQEGLVLDHINRNKLDNRRCNLRFVTRHTNNLNKNLGRGICYSERDKSWRAYITLNRKQISLGYYETEKEALIARADGEKKYHSSLR